MPSLQSPLVFALTITIPVVEYDEDKNNWNRYLNSLQIFLGITFATFVTKGNVQRGQYTMGVKTPYDTRIKYVKITKIL